MSSTLDDLALVENNDLVGVLDGTEAMSYNNDGLLALSNQLVEGLLHLMLTLGVQGTGGLIQEEHFRLANKGTSDGDTLLLPARKLNSSSSDKGFVTVREKLLVHDELVDGSLLASVVKHLNDLFLRLTFNVFLPDSVQNVVSDGVVEEDGLLLDDGHLTVVPLRVESSDVTAIESYSSLKRQVELLEHGDAAGLSATTSSD